MHVNARVRLALQALVLALVLVFWGQAVLSGWTQISQVGWKADLGMLAASACLVLAHLPLTALIWRQALRYAGIDAPVRWVLKSYLVSQLGRYIPGGVWDVAGRLYMSTERGLARGAVSLTILVEMVLGVVTGAIIFLGSRASWNRALPRETVFVSVAFVAAGLIGLHPLILGPALNLAARLLGRETAVLPLSYGQILVLASCHLLVRLLVGAAFFFFAAALTPLDWSLLPVFAGIFVAAWVMGFVVILAPQGLGVREGVMVFLLSFFLPVAVASVITVGFRVWLSLRDLAVAGVGAKL